MYAERSVSTHAEQNGNPHAGTTTMGRSVWHKEGSGLGPQAADGFGSQRLNTKHHRRIPRQDFPPTCRWPLFIIHLMNAELRTVAKH